VKRFLLSLLFVLGLSVPAAAQLGSVPFVFEPDTVISSSEVNTNFATVYSNSLLRTGGTMTGTLNSRDILPTTDNTYDLGSAAFSFQDGFFDGVLTAVTAAISNTGAAALDVAGGITAGTGNVGIIGTDGRIPALSSTFFASLSGANLTGILEANIADGTVYTRNAGNEVITGNWTIGTGAVLGFLTFNTPSLSNAGIVFLQDGVANGQLVQSNSASFWDSPGTQTWRTIAGVTRATLSSTGLFTAVGGVTNQGAEVNSNTVNGGTLSAGENHNVAPTGIGDASMVRYAGNAITPSKITGITGGVAGREITFCNTGTDLWSFKPEDSDSTSTNRIAGELSSEYLMNPETCAKVKYDPSSNRWRVLAGAQPMSPL
jgi:hypothetical protein